VNVDAAVLPIVATATPVRTAPAKEDRPVSATRSNSPQLKERAELDPAR